MNQARDVVFKKLFLFRLEYADDFASVRRVRTSKPEVQLLPVRWNWTQTEFGRTILIF